MFKITLIAAQLIIATLFLPTASANPFKKNSKAAMENEASSPTDSAKTDKKGKDLAAEYKKITKNATTKVGFFTTHVSKDMDLYFEMPDSAFADTYLISNRIAETSNTRDFVAGQMVTNPFMIRFSKNERNVYMHQVQYENVVNANDPIASAFAKNFSDPVIKTFKIVATNGKNVVIDASAFFNTNESCISPLKKENPLAKLIGGKAPIKATFVKEGSTISSVKTFPQNIEIRSLLCFNTLNEPYTVTAHRSLVKLPAKPLMMRLQDNRVGYFTSYRTLFSSEKDKVTPFTIINRWRLEPKAGEMGKYLSGELVEPAKPIVFYVDSAFPAKWKSSVAQGIEDWNIAFESAGFKNAIRSMDYPKNDPDFDPDDMRYSCIKYAATQTANAMGPSHIDPRSGEILTAEVLWYHNITSLLHDWRFAQTGAVDPRVRQTIFSDEVMQESMRYVASHEIGHTLGLMHNMGASYSFPVDSLRSATFTQKYGTTPSIMDYARNNYIAQPGDLEKGVKLTPPILGVYDIHAINWGYRIVPDAKTPQEEKAMLNKWIEDKKDDPMYLFGAQQFFGTIDPTAQTEDLGNDHIKAGNYAISNLKIIMQNLEAWNIDKGETFENIEEVYKAVVKQYTRHLGHMMPYIGGVRFTEIKQGDKGIAKSYISKAEQKNAMMWLLDQARTYNSWLTPATLTQRLALSPSVNDKYQLAVIGCLLHAANLYRIEESYMIDPKKNYSVDKYIDDVVSEIFKSSYKGEALNSTEILLQSAAITVMTNYTKLKTPLVTQGGSGSSNKLSLYNEIEKSYADVMNLANEPSLPCSRTCLHNHDEESADNSFYRINFGMPNISTYTAAPLMTAKLKKILALYRSKVASATGTTRNFYEYQIITLDALFKQ